MSYGFCLVAIFGRETIEANSLTFQARVGVHQQVKFHS